MFHTKRGQVSPTPVSPTINVSTTPKKKTGAFFSGFIVILVFHLADFFVFQFEHRIDRFLMYFFLTLLLLPLFVEKQKRKGTFLSILAILVFVFISFSIIFSSVNPVNYLAESFTTWFYVAIFIVLPFFVLALIKRSMGFSADFTIITFFLFSVFALPHAQNLFGLLNLLETTGIAISGVLMQSILDFLFFGVPVWWWYIANFQEAMPVPSWASLLNSLVVVFVTLAIITSNITAVLNVDEGGINREFTLASISTFFSNTFTNIQKITTQEITQFRNETTRQIDEARGVTFESRVENGATRDVGLHLDTIRMAKPRFRQDEQISAFSVVTAQVFDSPSEVQFACNAVQQNFEKASPIAGDLNQESLFVSNFLVDDLVCSFEPYKLKSQKSYTMQIDSTFNYVTSGYIQRYFTKEGLLQELAQSGLTPEQSFYRTYGVSNTQELSRFTKGPIELGLDISSPVIELQESDGKRRTFLLQIGITNNLRWEGALKNIKQVLISIPNGFIIAPKTGTGELSCTFAGAQGVIEPIPSNLCGAAGDFTDLDCTNYHHFLFSANTSKNEKTNPLENRFNEILLGCQIEASSPREILDVSPFSIESFRARVSYDYILRQEQLFFVDAPFEERDLNDESLIDREFCGATDAYTTTLNTDKLFHYTIDQQDRFQQIRNSVLASQDLKPSEKEFLEGGECQLRHIAWGLIENNWDQVKSSSNVGGVYFGYLQSTREMLDYLIAKDAVDITDLDERTPQQVATLLDNNGLTYSILYLEEMKKLCGVDNSIECITGKYACDIDFEFEDFSSCNDASMCRFCHETIIPNVVTTAAQSYYFVDKIGIVK